MPARIVSFDASIMRLPGSIQATRAFASQAVLFQRRLVEESKSGSSLRLKMLKNRRNRDTPAEASSSIAESLLGMVTEIDPPAQVILDVGAQILELSNAEVAREWLKRTQDHKQAQAVVNFPSSTARGESSVFKPRLSPTSLMYVSSSWMRPTQEEPT